MPYLFKKTPDDKRDEAIVTLELDHTEQSLDDMCTAFMDFLRGCGFVFDGNVEIVNDEDASDDDERPDIIYVSTDGSGEEGNS